MRHLTVTLAAWALLGSLCGPARAKEAATTKPASATSSPAVLLEKGIYTEDTVGDLDKAIAIYEQVIEQAKEISKYASQAHYRLGMCHLKKKQNHQAIQAFQQVLTLYPDQEDLAKEAKKRLAEAKGQMTKAEIAALVEDAVKTISTRGEGDPAIEPAIQSIDDLNDEAVVEELTKWLDSDKNTIRRSAIYILWKGQFDDIEPAVASLKKLLSHEESLTRGMAALALGGRKVRSSLDGISKMTLNDKDPFARRAAAYALGLLGDPAAKPVLEKALKDSNAMVRNNAEAALTLLSQASGMSAEEQLRRLPYEVTSYIIDLHMKAFWKAKSEGVWINTRIFGVDEEFTSYDGGLMNYVNRTDQPVSGLVHLGNFGRKKPNLLLVDESGESQEFTVRHRPSPGIGQQYAVWWKPNQPIQPNQIRMLGYINKASKSLPETNGKARLSMENHFVEPVLESFFLVIPHDAITVSESSSKPTSKAKIGQFTVYLWQLQVPQNTTHRVDVVLKKVTDSNVTSSQPAGASAAATSAAEQWLKLVDAGRYAESWDSTAAYFQKALSKEQWQTQLQSVRAPLGKLQSRKLLSATFTTSLPGAPDGQYVVVQFQADFENKTQAVETVTPLKADDGTWRVSGYYIK